MSKEKLFHVGVKALIQNVEGRILLLHSPGWAKNNTPPHWDIPGGRVQERQNILSALKREIQEETNITDISDPAFLTAVIANHEIPHEGRMLGLVLMIYKVTVPPGSRIILSSEHTDYEWVDKQEAAKRLSNKYPTEFTSLL